MDRKHKRNDVKSLWESTKIGTSAVAVNPCNADTELVTNSFYLRLTLATLNSPQLHDAARIADTPSPLRVARAGVHLSIITATRNCGTSLTELIHDLERQNCMDFEWVVVDAASTDNTMDLVRGAHGFPVTWISEPDTGIYHAINKGLRLATAAHYLVVGADDRLGPDAVSRYVTACTPDYDIVSAPVRCDRNILMPNPRLDYWRSKPPFVSAHSVGCVIRKSLHEKVGEYDTRLPIAADALFLLKAKAAGARLASIPMPPVGEFGGGGTSSRDILGAILESTRARIAVQGQPVLHLGLMLLRVLRNLRRILALSRARPPATAHGLDKACR